MRVSEGEDPVAGWVGVAQRGSEWRGWRLDAEGACEEAWHRAPHAPHSSA